MSWRYHWRQKFFDALINWYAPYLGAGVSMKNMTKDYRSCDVEMKLTWYNRNYVGTQFGGSLYSMTDPWYMLMLIKNLGKDYIVWDKGATIRFKKPGKTKVSAHFAITQADIDEVKAYVETHVKMDKVFKVNVVDENGVIVAEVEKVVYVRRKGEEMTGETASPDPRFIKKK